MGHDPVLFSMMLHKSHRNSCSIEFFVKQNDYDNDFLSFYNEQILGTDYDDADDDDDEMNDGWELGYFSSLSADADVDTDGDGLDNLDEFKKNTNPLDEDTDDDFYLDGDDKDPLHDLMVEIKVTQIFGIDDIDDGSEPDFYIRVHTDDDQEIDDPKTYGLEIWPTAEEALSYYSDGSYHHYYIETGRATY